MNQVCELAMSYGQKWQLIAFIPSTGAKYSYESWKNVCSKITKANALWGVGGIKLLNYS